MWVEGGFFHVKLGEHNVNIDFTRADSTKEKF